MLSSFHLPQSFPWKISVHFPILWVLRSYHILMVFSYHKSNISMTFYNESICLKVNLPPHLRKNLFLYFHEKVLPCLIPPHIVLSLEHYNILPSHVLSDIAFTVNKLSEFLQTPTDIHWVVLKCVLRYLHGTLHHGSRNSPLTLHVFSDVDWAGVKDSYCSTSGYIFT